MDNIKDDSEKRDFIYDSEDTDDDNASKYEFAPQVAVDSLASKRSPGWTEHESSVLLEAWGEKFLEHDRKNLRSEAWYEVVNKVSEVSIFERTKINCRNRIDSLKKKYKKEKAMLAQNIGSSSSWVHFSKMDMLMCPHPVVHLISSSSSDELTKSLGGNQEFEREENNNVVEKGHGSVNSEVHLISAASSDELTNSLGGSSESEKEENPNLVGKGHGFVNSEVHLSSATSSDKLTNSIEENSEFDNDDDENFVENNNLDENADLDDPPRKKPRMGKGKGGEDCLKLLADSIDKFTDLYDKIEKSKSTQVIEMKKIKMDFKRDMASQRGDFLKRAQIEIAKIQGADIEDANDLSMGNISRYI